MNIMKMARQLMSISNDLRFRRPNAGDNNYNEGELYDFDQTWGSTALGFGGVGGSAMTTERTYVFIPEGREKAFVYFGDQFAYMCDTSVTFWRDLKAKMMVGVARCGKYDKENSDKRS